MALKRVTWSSLLPRLEDLTVFLSIGNETYFASWCLGTTSGIVEAEPLPTNAKLISALRCIVETVIA